LKTSRKAVEGINKYLKILAMLETHLQSPKVFLDIVD